VAREKDDLDRSLLSNEELFCQLNQLFIMLIKALLDVEGAFYSSNATER
jgi:hypothetical protein